MAKKRSLSTLTELRRDIEINLFVKAGLTVLSLLPANDPKRQILIDLLRELLKA